MNDERPDELARVHYLPVQSDTEIVDAELVSDEEYRAIQRRKAAARREAYRKDAVTVYRGVKTVATHQRTKTVLRHGSYVFGGVAVIAKRLWEAKTNSRYERLMRVAEAQNNWEELREWEERGEQARERRHKRHMDWLDAPVKIAKAVAIGFGVLVGFLLVLGIVIALANKDIADVLGPIKAVLTFVKWIAYAVTVAWLPFILVLPWALTGMLYYVGRKAEAAPSWTLSPLNGAEGRDKIPDEGAIVNALRNLNLPALNRKFKEGWQPRWVLGSTYDERGWRSQLLLPEGVPVSDIVDKTEVLAHNLLRLPVEVWPTQPKDKPGVLDLYILDQGSLTKPVDPWPLLHEGTTDYFKGVPVGVNPQGKTILGRLFQANWGVAGMMGSGKSTLIITTLLGAMLDPLVEIDVYCMAFNADYDPLKPRLRTLFKSDEPDQIPVVLEALKQLMSELSDRGRKLSVAGEPKLTRKLAEADPAMRPRVVVIDECQELFVSEHGEEAAELVEKIVAKARKYGVTLIFATPVPSADSLPRKVAKVLSNRACYAIGDHQGNDAILGTGKHKAGITATTLRPMTEDADGTVDPGDIGTAMTVGFMSQDGLMRTYYPRRGEGVDEVSPVVKRAMALQQKADPAQWAGAPAADRRDLLDDVAEVLNGESLPVAQVATTLGTRFTRWGPYRNLTGKRLTALLEHEGVKVPSTGNRWPVEPDSVRDAIAKRAAETEDDE